jgi:HD-GYP domain-containing protein (c-di-GMP phosphodiesterase class II)
MLIFGRAAAHTWGEDEIAMVETAAELIGAAIERIESARAVQSQRDLLRVLETTSIKLGHVRGFQNILSILGEGAMALAKTYRAAVIMKQRDGRVTIPWMSGLTRSYAEGVTGQKPSSLACLFEIPAPVMMARGTNSPREAALGGILQMEAFAAIGLWPLVYDGQHIAVMACYYDEIPHLRALDDEMMQIFLHQAAAALENAGLYERLENQYVQAALTLAMAVEESETDPSERSQRMAELARETARRMGVSERGLEAIYWAALLHDIGKAAVPKEVLRKSEPLNAQEWEILHQIPLDGERYLGGVEHFRGAARLVRHCREHYDGGGYPDQLRGDQIPLGARILAVADAFQAMTEKRPYRKPLSPKEALAELHRLAGRQFDPRVVSMFDEWIRFETGEERLN